MDIFFILFALLTVVPAFLMVVTPNPVAGAVFLILSFIGMACLFVLLEAFFLAVLQILVYAGAIMVLFLFIIMLLDVREVEKLRPNTVTAAAAGVSLLLLVLGLIAVLAGDGLSGQLLSALPAVPDYPAADEPLGLAQKVKAYGYGLFTKYMLPFQLTGILLLIAMIGVIVLSKKRAAEEGAESAGADS